LNDLNKARVSFEEALNLSSHSSEACSGLGEVFFLAGMDVEAKTMFEHAVANDEENVAGRNGLAKVNKALGLSEDDNSLLVPVEERA
jgi:cytochrome c-type biogenesis protein CcmH/NrfG